MSNRFKPIEVKTFKDFRCEQCRHSYSAKVGEYEAAMCPKCQDTEHVCKTFETHHEYPPEDC